MIAYYKENIQIYTLLLVWLIVGMYGGPVIYALVPLTMFLLKKKGMYEELFLGYLFILILSDSLEDRLIFAKNVKNIYVSLLAIFLLFDLKSFQSLNKLYKTFLPFFLFSFFTMLLSVNESFFFISVQKTISYFISFLIIPNFIYKLYKEQGEQFFRSFLLFATTVLLFGFVLRYISFETAYLDGGRYRGVMGNPNGLGILCILIFIIFFIINDFYPHLFGKWEKIFIYVIILYSIILSGSRNAIIGITIFLVFQRFFSYSPFFGFIFFLIALLMAEIVSSNIVQIITSLGLSDYFRLNTLEEGSGRYIAWDFAWKQIQYNFFIGKGFAYNEYYMRQNYGILGKMGHQGGIHNSFLTFWMDQGLVGLLIYLRSYIIMFINAAKKSKYAYPIMFAISFTAVFESWLVGSLSAFAFLAMFIYTLISSNDLIAPKTELKEQLLTLAQ